MVTAVSKPESYQSHRLPAALIREAQTYSDAQLRILVSLVEDVSKSIEEDHCIAVFGSATNRSLTLFSDFDLAVFHHSKKLQTSDLRRQVEALASRHTSIQLIDGLTIHTRELGLFDYNRVLNSKFCAGNETIFRQIKSLYYESFIEQKMGELEEKIILDLRIRGLSRNEKAATDGYCLKSGFGGRVDYECIQLLKSYRRYHGQSCSDSDRQHISIDMQLIDTAKYYLQNIRGVNSTSVQYFNELNTFGNKRKFKPLSDVPVFLSESIISSARNRIWKAFNEQRKLR